MIKRSRETRLQKGRFASQSQGAGDILERHVEGTVAVGWDGASGGGSALFLAFYCENVLAPVRSPSLTAAQSLVMFIFFYSFEKRERPVTGVQPQVHLFSGKTSFRVIRNTKALDRREERGLSRAKRGKDPVFKEEKIKVDTQHQIGSYSTEEEKQHATRPQQGAFNFLSK